LEAEASQRQLVSQALFVSRFEQSWSKVPVNLDARRNDLVRSIFKSSRLPVFLFHVGLSTHARSELRKDAPRVDRPEWLSGGRILGQDVCSLARGRWRRRVGASW